MFKNLSQDSDLFNNPMHTETETLACFVSWQIQLDLFFVQFLRFWLFDYLQVKIRLYNSKQIWHYYYKDKLKAFCQSKETWRIICVDKFGNYVHQIAGIPWLVMVKSVSPWLIAHNTTIHYIRGQWGLFSIVHVKSTISSLSSLNIGNNFW